MTSHFFLRLLSIVSAVTAISIMATGCRSPKIDKDAKVRGADQGSYVGESTLFDPDASSGRTTSPSTPIAFEVPPPTEWSEPGGGIPVDPDGFEKVPGQVWPPVYFGYNRFSIGETERQKITRLADFLSENARYHCLVEGHCDERGSDEYNRALGERRALTVKEYLVQLGVDANRLRTLSYGEERPADSGSGESAWAKNRRAEFVILLPRN